VTIFFTSDTHFGDIRILRIDKRPFKSLEEHDAALIANWNDTVGPEDTVWHLGDFALGPSDERVATILSALHGAKHLITGNNDGPGTLAAPGWASVGAYAELQVDDTHLILCHYAFRTWNAMGRGAINLHGHSHGLLKTQPKQYDVGVDVWDFRPVTLEAIRARPRMTRIKRFERGDAAQE
jgi:calcineurin-like phosphoesterase family protein